MKILCFHNPDEENGYLSNWYLSEFNVSNITFSSMEQFMMYQKAMCFCDQTIAKKILTTHDVAQIKKFGRQVSNYNENRWNGIRQIVVYEGLLAKFSQNLNLKDLLKATGDNLLAECAVKDIESLRAFSDIMVKQQERIVHLEKENMELKEQIQNLNAQLNQQHEQSQYHKHENEQDFGMYL